jgi:hypothetical protein
MCLLSSICLTTFVFTALTRFIYAPLAGRCIRELLMEYFGDEKEAVEISDDGCCESCDKMKDSGTYDSKDDVLLVLRAIRDVQYSDRAGKKVCCIVFFCSCLFVC